VLQGENHAQADDWYAQMKDFCDPKIYGDKAFLELSRFDKETGAREISIQSIASMDKGQGIGKAVMKDITDTADELGMTLTLDAKPFGDQGLSKEALIKFYEKNGFVPDLEEAFGGEFETEEELIDYVREHTVIRKMKKNISLDGCIPENRTRLMKFFELLHQNPDTSIKSVREVVCKMKINY
jgi:GNAT superfamily N-acetyltransferase